jgi:hypothetical protein
MKDINGIAKAHRVDRPPCIGMVVYNDLQDGPLNPFRAFTVGYSSPHLCCIKGLAYVALNVFRKSFQISPRRRDPPDRFRSAIHYTSILILVYGATPRESDYRVPRPSSAMPQRIIPRAMNFSRVSGSPRTSLAQNRVHTDPSETMG